MPSVGRERGQRAIAAFPLPEPMRLALDEAARPPRRRGAGRRGGDSRAARCSASPATGCATCNDPTAHAEMVALRGPRREKIGRLPARRLRPLGDARALRDVRRGDRAGPDRPALFRRARSQGRRACCTVRACSPSRPATTRRKSIPASAKARPARCCGRFFRERRVISCRRRSTSRLGDARRSCLPRTLSLARRRHHPGAGGAERRVRHVGAGDRLVAQAAAEGDGARRAAGARRPRSTSPAIPAASSRPCRSASP